MRGDLVVWSYLRLLALSGLAVAFLGSEADAGGRGRVLRRGSQYAPTTIRVAPTSATVPGSLGTFTATPYIFTRGNGPAGGGYSPLGLFGDTTLSLYGPISGLRFTTAPVLTYSRGYNGQPIVGQGTSFSAPLLPALSPVVYPTQASNYIGFRQSGSPPWWPNAINWIDQN
jgi:hypothetical protein